MAASGHKAQLSYLIQRRCVLLFVPPAASEAKVSNHPVSSLFAARERGMVIHSSVDGLTIFADRLIWRLRLETLIISSCSFEYGKTSNHAMERTAGSFGSSFTMKFTFNPQQRALPSTVAHLVLVRSMRRRGKFIFAGCVIAHGILSWFRMAWCAGVSMAILDSGSTKAPPSLIAMCWTDFLCNLPLAPFTHRVSSEGWRLMVPRNIMRFTAFSLLPTASLQSRSFLSPFVRCERYFHVMRDWLMERPNPYGGCQR